MKGFYREYNKAKDLLTPPPIRAGLGVGFRVRFRVRFTVWVKARTHDWARVSFCVSVPNFSHHFFRSVYW
jgi:hypothetical protein